MPPRISLTSAPRVSRGPSLFPPLRRSLFELSEDPSTSRPTASILPPLPFTRATSWTSIALIAGLGLVAALLAVGWTGLFQRVARGEVDLTATSGPEAEELPWYPVRERLASAANVEDTSAPPDDPSRADAKLERGGRANVSRGVFFVPPTFASLDGAYDVILFFHGNTDLVENGMILSGINAAIVVFNYGNGSGVYDEKFRDPARLDDVLSRVGAELASRGLVDPRLRRLALVSWSAGYGAIQAILSNPKQADRVDGVVILDGMHAGFVGEGPQIQPLSLEPFVKFAERAAAGEKLFVLTHSNIEPTGYASVARSADLLLERVGAERKKASGETFIPAYVSLKGVLPAKDIVALEPRTEARVGSLFVKGYGGNDQRHHISHLIQLPDIALGHLVERWLPAK